MGGENRIVYVFSQIPRLATIVREKLPNVQVIDVKLMGDIEEKYCKEVCDEEVEALKDAEILLVDNNLLSQFTDRLPKLQWAQGTWAGVEALINSLKDKPKPSYPITRMVGEAFSQLMAEYVLAWIIAHERGWLRARENQLKTLWCHQGNIAYYRSLQDLTIGVLGMGSIGKEVAKFMKTFRAQVHAYTRTEPSKENRCENVDKYWHTGQLAEFLQSNDYIINIMPSTPATRGMLGGDAFKDAKKDAVFINVGRGDVISEADIIRSLDFGWLSAAILDVFIHEPLPKDCPLWTHPKVIISPHTAGRYVLRDNDVAEVFAKNYENFTKNKPLKGQVDFGKNY